MPPEQACPCVLGFAHTMLGFVLPSIVLYLLEAQERGAFRQLKREGPGRTELGLCLLEVILIPSLLLSLAAVIVWEAAVALAAHLH